VVDHRRIMPTLSNAAVAQRVATRLIPNLLASTLAVARRSRPLAGWLTQCLFDKEAENSTSKLHIAENSITGAGSNKQRDEGSSGDL
jgi:hypothetical protein